MALLNECGPEFEDLDSSADGFVYTDDKLSDIETEYIWVLGWLTLYPQFYFYALVAGVQMIRGALVKGRINMAIALFNSFPDDFILPFWKYCYENVDVTLPDEMDKLFSVPVCAMAKLYESTMNDLSQESQQDGNGTHNNGGEHSENSDLASDILGYDSATADWPTGLLVCFYAEYLYLLNLCNGYALYCDFMGTNLYYFDNDEININESLKEPIADLVSKIEDSFRVDILEKVFCIT
ncbi:hypothetical protein AX774_g2864 [Zancudomyces culisetae]|uniref:Nuclear pore complex protein n=1 Tax=Zancudomyces culisetae TaxID=1213189 RepID=A0A1R1PRR0_ZANCU|nr:hypothetical protein AX774_g2864 [Zancudomyces culisetae]|eukprot:OMH83619.1 hypothetical protein AX774_g2864 [Zancudomyces culisetae]